MRSAENLTTITCCLEIPEASTSWSPKGPAQACNGRAVPLYEMGTHFTEWEIEKGSGSIGSVVQNYLVQRIK